MVLFDSVGKPIPSNSVRFEERRPVLEFKLAYLSVTKQRYRAKRKQGKNKNTKSRKITTIKHTAEKVKSKQRQKHVSKRVLNS